MGISISKKSVVPFIIMLAAALAVLFPARGTTGPVLTDQSISDAIDDELIFDQAIDRNDINISVHDGIVTLSGEVDNVIEKERAEKIAETVKGVRSVVNSIKVDPYWGRMDREIENDVKDALLFDPATESWEIDVKVEDNVATITGTVGSWQERNLAETVVKGVRGVAEVDNRLEVDYRESRTDQEIKAEIEETFRWNIKLDDALIGVKVDDGHVKLSGTVGSTAEKSEAELKAWVRGVESVDSSRLEVEKWARDDDLREDKYVVKSDQEVEKAIYEALLYDPRVNSLNVTPEVSMGEATLRGTVKNLRAKRAAASDVRNTVGVLTLNNLLKVEPPEDPGDQAIQTNIAGALKRNPFLERYEIGVNVIDQTVYLSGIVDSYFDKSEAEDVASEAEGVEEVRNNLKVERPYDPLSYDPYLDDYYLYDYDWYDYTPGTTFKTDFEIEEEINDELFWSPFVDGDDIEVEVVNGEAELTGTVDTVAEYNAATENAYEGGAVWVDNDLVIK